MIDVLFIVVCQAATLAVLIVQTRKLFRARARWRREPPIVIDWAADFNLLTGSLSVALPRISSHVFRMHTSGTFVWSHCSCEEWMATVYKTKENTALIRSLWVNHFLLIWWALQMDRGTIDVTGAVDLSACCSPSSAVVS